MPQQGTFSTWDVVTTSLTHSSVYTGFTCRSELHSRWRRWRIVHCMALHHLTWRRLSYMSPTYVTPTPAQVCLTEQLDVPTCRLSTVGGCAFPVAGAKVSNNLPSDVTSASSLSVFKNTLKTYLYRHCYETVWLIMTFPITSHNPPRTVVLAIVYCLGHHFKMSLMMMITIWW